MIVNKKERGYYKCYFNIFIYIHTFIYIYVYIYIDIDIYTFI